MMQTEINKFQAVFEPGTVSGSELISLEGAALASIAISLKRLADAWGKTDYSATLSSWRDQPVTMAFLADLFAALSGAEGHNLVVMLATNASKQKL